MVAAVPDCPLGRLPRMSRFPENLSQAGCAPHSGHERRSAADLWGRRGLHSGPTLECLLQNVHDPCSENALAVLLLDVASQPLLKQSLCSRDLHRALFSQQLNVSASELGENSEAQPVSTAWQPSMYCSLLGCLKLEQCTKICSAIISRAAR